MTTRLTAYTYDWRGRRVATGGEVDFYQETAYDNLDRPTVTQRRNASPGGNLVAKSEVKYDARGRVYQTVVSLQQACNSLEDASLGSPGGRGKGVGDVQAWRS